MENAMGIPENIDALLVKHDLTPAALARIAEVSESTISRWRNGGNIRTENLNKILDYFGLVPDDILSSSAGLAAKEHGTYIPEGFFPITAAKTVPIKVVDHVHAGIPTEPEETDYILQVPQEVMRPGHKYIGYIVDGDCMNKIYPEGCLIAIELNPEPRNGSIGVFKLNGYKTVMRRVYRGLNTLILSPESFNPEHRDIVLTDDGETTVEAIGTVVWFQSREVLD